MTWAVCRPNARRSAKPPTSATRGEGRNRTGDLLCAKQALYLSELHPRWHNSIVEAHPDTNRWRSLTQPAVPPGSCRLTEPPAGPASTGPPSDAKHPQTHNRTGVRPSERPPAAGPCHGKARRLRRQAHTTPRWRGRERRSFQFSESPIRSSPESRRDNVIVSPMMSPDLTRGEAKNTASSASESLLPATTSSRSPLL